MLYQASGGYIMQNIDNLIQQVYDENGALAELRVKFDTSAGEWVCRIQEDGYDWLDDAGERYLVARDFDLQTAMNKLDQLCARQPGRTTL